MGQAGAATLRRVFVKICGLTTEEDALLAVAVGADALGFIFAPSKRQVTASRVADIVKRLPREITTVAVFRDETPTRIRQIVNQTGVTAVQLHGHETPDIVAEVKLDVRTVFKAVPAGSEAFMQAHEFGADAILVDNPNPGSGQLFDWRLAEDAPFSVPLILAGGLDPTNVADAIRKVRPWGVDVASGVERAPGIKDPILVRDFVAAARAFDEVPYESPEPLGMEPYNWQEDATWR